MGQAAQHPALAEEQAAEGDIPLQVPAFDPTQYVLGPLCVHGHNFDGHGHSLKQKRRNGEPGACVTCQAERAEERQTKAVTPPAAASEPPAPLPRKRKTRAATS